MNPSRMKHNEAPDRLLRSRVKEKCLVRAEKGEGGEVLTRCTSIGGIWAIERSNREPEWVEDV
ncbi:hypothetical protein E2C01_004777 [Portunus trituberculatus]|uniref:Uncharacterized protein n=1 Tax=Portunus trituberculatus TaxID=210409 RepID=A0A5B7CRF8_PORTR|nr:hypothetical protein [Portunus trituberculatus]